jgi:hypothetical protein
VFPDINAVFSAPVINLLSFGAIGIFASNDFFVSLYVKVFGVAP